MTHTRTNILNTNQRKRLRTKTEHINELSFFFSESTDDDKVVEWHWEEVKGPLREEKVSADTPVLTLTSLVPGNYTFR